MSVRSVIIGLCLGLLVASLTFFSDYVMMQTFLIGNFFPVSIFGVLLVLTLILNPLMRWAGLPWSFRAGELAIIAAIGLAACGFPSSGFFRTYNNVVSLPAHWQRTNTSWQDNQVMSYLPGGSADLAVGHVTDFPRLHRALIEALETKADTDVETISTVLTYAITPAQRAQLQRLSPADLIQVEARRTLLKIVNEALIRPSTYDGGRIDDPERSLTQRWSSVTEDREEAMAVGVLFQQASDYFDRSERLREQARQLAASRDANDFDEDQLFLAEAEADYFLAEAILTEQQANRAALVRMLPLAILPQPPGEGWQTSGGRADRFVTDTMLQGRGHSNWLGVSELPWYAIWPPARLWWIVFILFGLGTLCLAVILHPQWSRHELLPYPIPRFVQEVTRCEQQGWLPDICRPRLFWIGAGAMILLHLINGLHAWFDFLPQIPMRLDFNPLRSLFPEFARISGAYAYFAPTVFPTVVAFTFFLTAPVAFSLGISQIVYMVTMVGLRRRGIVLEEGFFKNSSLQVFRFGTVLGFFLLVVYTGRRYYRSVVVAMLGGKRAEDVPPSAVWAARLLVILFALIVVVLSRAGLDPFIAAVVVAMLFMLMIILSRITAETGMIMIQANWLPVGVLTTMFGFEAIGPTLYISLMIISVLLMVDPREAVMQYFVNALQIADKSADESPRRVAPWLAVMLVVGFLVAGVVTMYLHYNVSSIGQDPWGVRAVPTRTFDMLSQQISESVSRGTLSDSAALEGFERFSAAMNNLSMSMFGVLVLGVFVVVATAIARLRLPWWPIHPVLFLVFSTYPINMFSGSFLLGWLIKISVIGTGGARGYQNVKPLMVGIIAGEMLMALVWIIVGTVYYFATGQTPQSYRIFPA